MGARTAEIDTVALRHVAETGSTSEDALAAGRSGATGPLWIRADRQLTGRGRQGRAWASPPGNLYCSVLFPVAAEATFLSQLSHVAAVALTGALRAVLGEIAGLRIKWPNDLLVDGAKVAGILVEGTRAPSGVQLCVIGCGVNCSAYPEGLAYRATSLAAVTARPVDPGALFDALRSTMAEAIATWDDGRGYAEIRSRWLAQALPVGTVLVVRGPGQATSGTFQGIDDKGRLLLLGPDGPVTVEAGEVNLN